MDWEKISTLVPNRNKITCKNRWVKTQQTKNPKLVWTKEEDSLLIKLVESDPEINWEEISAQFNSKFPDRERSKLQCKIRWTKFLDPRINKQVILIET